MLLAVAAKHQAAIVAPTEILAEQHLASINRMLEGSRVRTALLTGALDPLSRAALIQRIAEGDVDIVIGTHALLEQSVRFASLAVAVIDEQHRFGVHQRARLREKSSDPKSSPHTLVMTATPIPRTLALTVFGDLDVSILRGLPPGRIPVRTEAIPAVRAEDAYRTLADRVLAGEQAYIVVPAVDPTSDGTIKDVNSTHRRLEAHWLPGKRVASIHGRLKQETRQRIMERFRLGLIDALVATTVIEVGVDVPNATVMLVEHADRFGLAQLHQLRGRVGRGTKPGLCLLVAHDPSPHAMERLTALVRSTDGFEIAEKDLEIRGIGELFGTRQAGASPFRLAQFPRDTELLLMARRDAAPWIERSPVLDQPDEMLLRSRLFKAHGQSLGLIDIA
jgi:ATP-dependent DNA helicase RecG